MKRNPPSPLKRHLRPKRATYEDLVDFRHLNERQKFLVLEELNRKGNATEIFALLAVFGAFYAVLAGPTFTLGYNSEAANDVLMISMIALFFILVMLIIFGGSAMERKRKAHLYETFGLKQPQQPTSAELVASYQKSRRRWGRRRTGSR